MYLDKYGKYHAEVEKHKMISLICDIKKKQRRENNKILRAWVGVIAQL